MARHERTHNKKAFAQSKQKVHHERTLHSQLRDQKQLKHQEQLERQGQLKRREQLKRQEQLKHQKQLERQKEIFFRIAKSNIDGKGVFANIAIPMDTDILEYRGKRITRAQADVAEAKYLKEKIKKTYLFAVTEAKDLVIDATKEINCKARYINHVCSPRGKHKYSRNCKGSNCAVKVVEFRGQKRIIIYTRRAIAKG